MEFINLKKELSKRNISDRKLARLIGIHYNTMGIKLNRQRDFTYSEMRAIQKLLSDDKVLSLDYLFRERKEENDK